MKACFLKIEIVLAEKKESVEIKIDQYEPDTVYKILKKTVVGDIPFGRQISRVEYIERGL
ncbi:MAG TPA: hypothetical protein PK466_11715 [Thermotogota bacterium]|nr:hypothetical protein [Thermotogota bacterium]HPJ90126.1 hypothetical protein [Thermotogota bacterium]HPR96990.1 hypothetical protein [Thermotogota bacterium]